MKELCDCGEFGVWFYAPVTDIKRNPYYCDDCVPRGCSCNHYHVDENVYSEEDQPIKWIEEDKVWCSVDEQGREYPCCEYWYEEEGWEVEE